MGQRLNPHSRTQIWGTSKTSLELGPRGYSYERRVRTETADRAGLASMIYKTELRGSLSPLMRSLVTFERQNGHVSISVDMRTMPRQTGIKAVDQLARRLELMLPRRA